MAGRIALSLYVVFDMLVKGTEVNLGKLKYHYAKNPEQSKKALLAMAGFVPAILEKPITVTCGMSDQDKDRAIPASQAHRGAQRKYLFVADGVGFNATPDQARTILANWDVMPDRSVVEIVFDCGAKLSNVSTSDPITVNL